MTDHYVELHAASAFSFLEGASQPEKLVERAVELEMAAMALVDRNGVDGSARFHTSAKRNTIRAHVGAEIAVSDIGLRLAPPIWLPHQHMEEPARIPLLCESREGYQNLCQLITRFKMRETSKQDGAARRVHDDAVSVSLNQKLSEDRANSVTRFLLQQGHIPLTNILAPGAMGESRQVGSDKTAEGQAQNRRVVVRILQNKGVAGT
jgi:DNA polymerase III alpha subunit